MLMKASSSVARSACSSRTKIPLRASAPEIRDLIRSLPGRGATTLLCTHRLAEVEATCDYVVVLRRGRLLVQGPLDDVIAGAVARGYRVEVDPSEVETTLRILASLPLGELSVEGGVVSTTRHIEDPWRISRALAHEGIFVRELHAERATLEEAFINIIDKAAA